MAGVYESNKKLEKAIDCYAKAIDINHKYV